MKRVAPIAILLLFAFAGFARAGIPSNPPRIDMILTDGRLLVYAGTEDGVNAGDEFLLIRYGEVIGRVEIEEAEGRRSIGRLEHGSDPAREWDILWPLNDPVDSIVLYGGPGIRTSYYEYEQPYDNVAVREEVRIKQKKDEERKVAVMAGGERRRFEPRAEEIGEEAPVPEAAGACDSRVIAIAGNSEVMLKSQGSSAWVPAELQQCLSAGDMIRTSADGTMAIGFGGTIEEPDTRADINVNSTLTITGQ